MIKPGSRRSQNSSRPASLPISRYTVPAGQSIVFVDCATQGDRNNNMAKRLMRNTTGIGKHVTNILIPTAGYLLSGCRCSVGARVV
jgi:hypothetical protein